MSFRFDSKSDTIQLLKEPTVKRSKRGFRRWLANKMFGRHSSDLVLKRSAGGKVDFPKNDIPGGSGDQPLKQVMVTPGSQKDTVLRINAQCGFKPLLPPTPAPVTGHRHANGLSLFQGYHDNMPASHTDDISILITYSREAAGPDAASGPPSRQFSPGAAMMPYNIRDLIGYGGQGVVYTAAQDDKKVVVKLARKAAWIGLIMNEFILMKELRHPNVVQAVSPVRGGFVMEVVHTDLASLLDAGTLTIQSRLRVTGGVLAGLSYIHARGIAHLDIKPSNVLMDRQYSPKLADFGFSARFLDPLGNQRLLYKSVGTLAYMAPEVMTYRRGGPLGVSMAPVDVWACGCLVYELVTRTVPFGDENIQDIITRQMALATQRLGVPTNTASYIRADRIAGHLFMVARQMLDINPDKRPSAALMVRPYLGNVKE